MVLNVHRNHKAYYGRGKGGDGGRGRLYICLSLHCHHQNDSCIKIGSDESHFNASLIVRDKVTRRCPQTTTFEEKGKPKRIRTDVHLLTSLIPVGQTGSPTYSCGLYSQCIATLPDADNVTMNAVASLSPPRPPPPLPGPISSAGSYAMLTLDSIFRSIGL